MNSPWRITLFGELQAQLASGLNFAPVLVNRFRTRKTALLLGYLALHARERQPHAREALAERLWPETDPVAARNRLKQEIAALRRQLEPPGIVAGSVLMADRFTLQLNPAAILTDVYEFEQLLLTATRTEERSARIDLFTRACLLYQADLLAAFYEDWVLEARQRLREQFLDTLLLLSTEHQNAGDLTAAIECLRRAIPYDPLRDTVQTRLVRLLSASGETTEARRQYEDWAQLYQKEFGILPEESLASLTRDLPSRDSNRATSLPDRTAPKSIHSAAPSVAPLPTRKTVRLPLQFTRFFGRTREIEQITATLCGSVGRLVTLTGPGGSGKTRLAIEAARAASSFFPGGVFFVPFASLTASADAPEAILRALEIEVNSGSDARQQAIHAIAERNVSLLVLDNVEHLLPVDVRGGSFLTLIQALREGATNVTLLITSRLRLDLAGEEEFVIPPLPIPHGQTDPERLMECESIQLFVDRARLANQDFQLTSRNAASVATLCQMLDGIPLALELAAAWARTLTVHQICDSLNRSLALLVSRRRDVAERHRSLSAAFAWSYELLSGEDRSTFAEISVFAGAFSLSDAEAVCTERPLLSRIENLCHCSLLRSNPGVDAVEASYRLLEPLREFAREHLREMPEQETVRQRHREWFAAFARQQRAYFYTAGEADALRRLESRNDNLREARDAASRAGDIPALVDLILALCGLAQRRGYIFVAIDHVEFGLKSLMVDVARHPLFYAVLLRERAGLYLDQEEPDAAERSALQSLDLLKATWSEQEIPPTLNVLAQAHLARRRYEEARSLLNESLILAEKQGSAVLIGILHNNRGLVEQRDPAGDPEAATFHLEEALRRHQNQGNLRGAASSLNNLGILMHTGNDLKAAARYYRQALDYERQVGHSFGIGRALNNLGEIAEAQGKSDHALWLYVAAERIFAELRSPYRDYARDRLEEAARNSPSIVELASLRREASGLAIETLCEWSLF